MLNQSLALRTYRNFWRATSKIHALRCLCFKHERWPRLGFSTISSKLGATSARLRSAHQTASILPPKTPIPAMPSWLTTGPPSFAKNNGGRPLREKGLDQRKIGKLLSEHRAGIFELIHKGGGARMLRVFLVNKETRNFAQRVEDGLSIFG